MSLFLLSLRRPRLALAVLAIAVMLAGMALRTATVDFSIERMYPKDSPSAAFAAEHRERFGREDDVMMVIPEKGTAPEDPSLATLAARLSNDPRFVEVAHAAATPGCTEMARARSPPGFPSPGSGIHCSRVCWSLPMAARGRCWPERRPSSPPTPTERP